MYPRPAFLFVTLFAASCAAAPVSGNHARARAEQPELSARDPFNVGDLIHLNSISAAVEKLDPTRRRSDELAQRTPQSLTEGGSADSGTTNSRALTEGDLRLPSTLENNLLIGASDELAQRTPHSLNEGKSADSGTTNSRALTERDLRLPSTLENNLLIGASLGISDNTPF